MKVRHDSMLPRPTGERGCWRRPAHHLWSPSTEGQKVQRRAGFTLVEMLVVISIVVLLATFATIMTLRMQGRDVVPKAATLVQGALAQAKARAMNEGKGHGVRLWITYEPAPYPTASEVPYGLPANLIPVVRQIQFIQDPGDFRDGWVWGTPHLFINPNTGNPDLQGRGEPVEIPVFTPPSAGNPLPGYRMPDVNASQTAAGWVQKLVPHDPLDPPNPNLPPPALTLYGPFAHDWREDPELNNAAPTRPPQRPNFTFVGFVEPGDLVEVQNNGRLYQIVGVFPPNWTGNPLQTLPSRLRLAFYPTLPVPDNGALMETVSPPRAIDADAAQFGALASNYRIIRRPRPIPGERPIDLPDRTVVDLCWPVPAALTPTPIPPNPNPNKDPLTQELWFRGVSNALVVPGQTFFDVMFAPSGEVTFASNGMERENAIYLWIRENPAAPLATLNWYDTANGGAGSPDNQALVAVYTRSGAVMTYPVDQASPNNPHTLAQTGRGSGGP